MPVATVHLENRTATTIKLRTSEEGPILKLLSHQHTKTQRAAQEHTRQREERKKELSGHLIDPNLRSGKEEPSEDTFL
jgi:septum formation inhibitor MinC